MKLKQAKRVLLILLTSFALMGITVNADETTNDNDVSSEKTTNDMEEPAQEDNSEIKVFTSLTDNHLKVSITNTSEEDMKNTALLFSKENRYSVANNYKDLGTIKSGETEYLDVTVMNVGHGILNNFCDAVGGTAYGLSFIGVSVVVIAIYFGRLIYRKKKGKKGKGSTIAFTLAGVTIILACGVLLRNVPEYQPLDEGQNYIRDIKETYNDEDLLFELKYNQDIIEEKVSSKEEPIDFDVEYTYDENKPVTEENEVVSEGQEGVQIVTTTTVYRNGKVDSTTKDTYVTQEPVAQKEIQGTKTTIQIENIVAKRVYIPDDTMYLGESNLESTVEEAEENLGKKEVTYTWNEEKEEIESSEKVTKEPGTNIWRAGTKVERVTTIDPTVTYTPVDTMEVGTRNVIEEAIPGSITTTYTTQINEKTGKEVSNPQYTYVGSQRVEPENGSVEEGVLLT